MSHPRSKQIRNLETYAKQATVVHLEIDPAEISKNVKAHFPVLGSCKESLPQLTRLVKHQEYADWKQLFADHMAIEIKELVVKFTVEQKNELSKLTDVSLSREYEKRLIERCTEKVLNKIYRHEER